MLILPFGRRRSEKRQVKKFGVFCFYIILSNSVTHFIFLFFWDLYPPKNTQSANNIFVLRFDVEI
ncbi:MAG: hypothetical protein EAZ97_15275 [Bacteroidetes bacterium]|nr:MAG: hypothetical protein EAZ97_15275 [Bacteroidota bacterium]